MTEAEMSTALGYAAIAFGKELSPEVVLVYFDQLGGYDSRLIAKAVKRCVARGDHFPTVVDIRNEIREVQDTQRDPTVARNMAIARKVDEARRLGQVTTPDEVAALVTDLEKRWSVKRIGA